MKQIIDKASQMHTLSYEELLSLIQDDSCNQYLYQKSDEIRKKYVGDEVHLRGLIEFSNICARTCKYCGLQRDNKNLERYKMSPDEIYQTAKHAVSMGYKTLVLQSGESEAYSIETLCSVIRKIKLLNVAVTLSIGEKNEAEYRALRDAGADRYLLRIETTSPSLYRRLHPDMSLLKRKSCLKFLKEHGFETGTGCIVGLPGQTDESLAYDILFFKELDADMVGIGPFIPHPDTPLKDDFSGTFEKALKIMAITRLILPDINIPATTAMETLNPNGRIIALQSGANVVMPNVNATEYRAKYEIYPNKICINDNPDKCRGCIEAKITSIGRTISNSKGFRLKTH